VGHTQLLLVGRFWLVWLTVGCQHLCACFQGQWCGIFPLAGVVWCGVVWCGVVWCGVGASVPVLEAGGVVSFSWHGDMAPWGIHGVSGRARCHVVAVAVLCGCAGPVGVGHYDMAGCGAPQFHSKPHLSCLIVPAPPTYLLIDPTSSHCTPSITAL
jgi:hypothetical protein